MEAFGEMVGASKSMVSKWERGLALPRRAAMQRVNTATCGAVKPSDFVDGILPVERYGGGK